MFVWQLQMSFDIGCELCVHICMFTSMVLYTNMCVLSVSE